MTKITIKKSTKKSRATAKSYKLAVRQVKKEGQKTKKSQKAMTRYCKLRGDYKYLRGTASPKR
jgi:hypothetical protein